MPLPLTMVNNHSGGLNGHVLPCQLFTIIHPVATPPQVQSPQKQKSTLIHLSHRFIPLALTLSCQQIISRALSPCCSVWPQLYAVARVRMQSNTGDAVRIPSSQLATSCVSLALGGSRLN